MKRVSRRQVERWETGKETPTWAQLERIAELLKTTPETLAECDREEFERTFPTAASRGVPWWRRIGRQDP